MAAAGHTMRVSQPNILCARTFLKEAYKCKKGLIEAHILLKYIDQIGENLITNDAI